MAEEIFKQFVLRESTSPSTVASILSRIEAVAEGTSPLAVTFGAPAYVYSVALIWPRPHGASLKGELRCRVYRCTSWSRVELPEVLFLPNILVGQGGKLEDRWWIPYRLPAAAHCATHRHRPILDIPIG